MKARTHADYVQVLIESDWNLKTIYDENITPLESSINRIRLEFKDHQSMTPHPSACRINRIRLEFKVAKAVLSSVCDKVLIESDWNLKQLMGRYSH